MNNSELGHDWFYNEDKDGSGKGSNFFYEGNTIYSYGHHFPIAKKIGNHTVLFTNQSYSVSTSKHISTTRQSIPQSVRVIYVSDPSADSKAAHKKNYRELKSNLQALRPKLARTRTGWNRDTTIRDMQNIIEDLNDYTRLFKLGFHQVPGFVFNEKENKEMGSRLRKAAAKKRAAVLKRNKNQIDNWKAGKIKSLSWSINDVFLRITDDNIQSSKGAIVNINAAKRIWKAICKVKETKQPFSGSLSVGRYTLNNITAAGNVTIGCHHIKYQELAGIAGQLDL